MDELKTTKGRLREAGVLRIHELRDAFDATGKAKTPSKQWTYQALASMLQVSLGTVYNVATGRTWPHLHPSNTHKASA